MRSTTLSSGKVPCGVHILFVTAFTFSDSILLTVTEKVQEVLRLQRALDHSVQEAARCNCFIAKARERLLQGGKSVDCAVYVATFSMTLILW